MNFFCTKKELDEYVEKMGLTDSKIIRADLKTALIEAEGIFSVNPGQVVQKREAGSIIPQLTKKPASQSICSKAG